MCRIDFRLNFLALDFEFPRPGTRRKCIRNFTKTYCFKYSVISRLQGGLVGPLFLGIDLGDVQGWYIDQ